MRVLVVDDDVKMGSILRRGLSAEGMAVDVVTDAQEALVRATTTDYAVVVLDVMLPGQDGFAVCRDLRERGLWPGVVMLTARDGVADRVTGLNSGADDYLVKPFSFAELVARLRAVARRGTVERPVVLEAGNLRLEPAAHRVWRDGIMIELSPKECALLEVLVRHPGQVLSRFYLLEQAWSYDYEHRSNVLEVYIRYLREKIDRPFQCHSIQTVRGVGYRFCAD
ncbi:MAG TPA: response regulator transcription factor [Solirubrobacteraceae bacterium]|nr:response regulator transcription factor [Solirubrobacteraceae bacterium]